MLRRPARLASLLSLKFRSLLNRVTDQSKYTTRWKAFHSMYTAVVKELR